MKKLVVLLLLLIWPGLCARAETWQIDCPDNRLYHAQTFEEQLPAALEKVVGASPFARDRLLQGVLLSVQYKNTGEWGDQYALLAVEKDEAVLLLAASAVEGGAWTLAPASDTLVKPGESFTLTARTSLNSKGLINHVIPGVRKGEEFWGVRGWNEAAQLDWYGCLDNEDSGVIVDIQYPDYEWVYRRVEKGVTTYSKTYRIAMQGRLDLIDPDTFPRTEEMLAQWQERCPVTEEGVYVFSANLRERPTGKSKSLGVYRTAPAQVLDSVQGAQLPWYQVRIGDTVGWMSGAYVASKTDRVNHGLGQVAAPAIAVCRGETTLYQTPDGAAKQTLPAGTAMHILADCDGWYHVVLPRGDLSWKIDAEGSYGYVRVKDVAEYASPLCMKYGVE